MFHKFKMSMPKNVNAEIKIINFRPKSKRTLIEVSFEGFCVFILGGELRNILCNFLFLFLLKSL